GDTVKPALQIIKTKPGTKLVSGAMVMIGPNGAVNLQIIVSQLYADVSQGSVRYNIATKADIAVLRTDLLAELKTDISQLELKLPIRMGLMLSATAGVMLAAIKLML
ncbi:MAG: YajG family lipoprotein, partial [Pseudomonas sp.]|nr:YajG family lipoprotein [Pseudomonas sp.]